MSLEAFGSQTESQGFRMPKRKGNWSHAGGKRRRFGRKFAPKNQFINQLGGWSSRAVVRSRDVLREFNTPVKTFSAGAGLATRDDLVMLMSDIPGGIRDVYQRIKVKKVTVFINVRGSQGDNSIDTIQFSICRSNQDDGAINPLNVPGSQVKLMDVQGTQVAGNVSNISDIIRCARYYPTLRVSVDGGNAGAGRAEISAYADTNKPTTIWNCFNWNISGLESGNTVVCSYYLHCVLLCNTMKA